MVWDLETMQRKNEEAVQKYMDRNRTFVDSVMNEILVTVVEQINSSVRIINSETMEVIEAIKEEVKKELAPVVVEKTGQKE